MAQRYEFLERISSGGMGEVFLAASSGEHGFTKRVAVKRVLPELAKDAAFVDRFVSEAKLAVSLTHANLVQVFDLARAGDELFLAMELVEGADLRRLLQLAAARSEAVPVGIVLHVAAEALKGLAFAHAAGVVHCDISPANLLVSRAGEVKVADFGVAQILSTRRGSNSQVVGKLRYMAPEMLRGQAIDARTDLYSLALVLHEALSQRPVFERETTELTTAAVLEGALPRVTTLRPEVPEPLSELLARATAVDANLRPAHAREMLTEIMSIAQSLPPVTAPDVGSWVQTLVPAATPDRPKGLDLALGQLMGGGASAAGTQSMAARPLRALTFVARANTDGTSVWVPVNHEQPQSRPRWKVALGAAALVGAVASVVLWPRPTSAPSAPLAPAAVVASPAVAEPVLAPPEPVVAPPVAAVVAAKPGAKVPRIGWLNLNAQPWANVVIDGKKMGATPLAGLALPAGAHHVRFEKQGSKPVERSVVVVAKQTQTLDVDLAPAGP